MWYVFLRSPLGHLIGSGSYKRCANQRLCLFFRERTLLQVNRNKQKIIKFIIVSYSNYSPKDDPLSNHLVVMESEPWKKLRTKLTPTFTSGKMKFMFPTVVEIGERFRNCLVEVVQQHDELEIKDLLARFSTDVIGTCAFGIECNSLKDPNAEFKRYGRAVFEKPRHSLIFSAFLQTFKKLARKLHIKSIRDDVALFFMKVVRETVEYREKNKVQRNDFMDILIKLKNKDTTDKSEAITFNELAAQSYVFFLAGFETSSTMLTFCLYELALNPVIQEKARNVIREAYKKHNGCFTYEMLMNMPYIDQVLQGDFCSHQMLCTLYALILIHSNIETLRKYPPVAILDRKSESDYQVSATNLTIEKGVKVLIPILAIQHDPKYYPNPEKFDPDRFEIEEVKKRNPMTWLPFGDGPRNCIGIRFGMMQARIALVTLLNNFEFSPGTNLPIPIIIDYRLFVNSPKDDVYLKVKSINS